MAAVHTDGARRAGAVSGPVTIVPVGNASYQLLDVPLMLDAQADGCALLGMCGASRPAGREAHCT